MIPNSLRTGKITGNFLKSKVAASERGFISRTKYQNHYRIILHIVNLRLFWRTLTLPRTRDVTYRDTCDKTD
jgi:hypothetical protein